MSDYDKFTITLTDGTAITENEPGQSPEQYLNFESYGLQIISRYTDHQTTIPWHRIANVDAGADHRLDGAA